MQKRFKIRWRDADQKALSNAVRKFNAKRTRLINKVPELEEFLPKKLNVKEIKSGIVTRKDYTNVINSIERFMRKGAEKPIITKEGVKLTVYEKKELQIKLRTINRRRTAERKKANVSTEKGTMGTIRANNLLPKPSNLDKIKKSDWDMFVKSVEKQSKNSYYYERDERYKANYIQGLRNVFGESADELIALVNLIPAEIIVQMQYDQPILQLDFFYDPLELEVKLEAITEYLEKYLNKLSK